MAQGFVCALRVEFLLLIRRGDSAFQAPNWGISLFIEIPYDDTLLAGYSSWPIWNANENNLKPREQKRERTAKKGKKGEKAPIAQILTISAELGLLGEWNFNKH